MKLIRFPFGLKLNPAFVESVEYDVDSDKVVVVMASGNIHRIAPFQNRTGEELTERIATLFEEKTKEF